MPLREFGVFMQKCEINLFLDHCYGRSSTAARDFCNFGQKYVSCASLLFRRPHKHNGCRIPHPTVAVTFDEGNTEKNMSDYKARFPAYHPPQPARPIYQQQELERTDPSLPMDLNTIKQTSYTRFNDVAKRKPCKVR